ncbi:MAG: hypothetical protein KJO08_10325, partial [Gammaproteobacteria bacterium]|nr:hypothetical protein [Gammaproteobacteria bacterium]
MVFSHNFTDKVSMGVAVWLATTILVSYSQYAEASDYNYTGSRQNQSWGGQQQDYSTRWARDTKPWSRDLSGVEQSGFDRKGSSYSTGRGQWNDESSGRDWRSDRGPSYAGDFQQSDGWYQDSPAHTRQHAETGSETDYWGSMKEQQALSSEQRDPWAKQKDRQKSDPWPSSRSASENRDDRWSEDTSWSRGSKSQSPPNAYGNTPWYDESQSAKSESPRDYSSSGTLSAPQDAWSQDPWPENSSKNSRRGAKTHASDAGLSQGQKHWDSNRKAREEDRSEANRRWDTSRYREKNEQRAKYKQQPEPAYRASLPETTQPGYPEYSGYTNHLGSSEYAPLYPSEQGYGPPPVPGYGHESYG